MVCSVEAGTTYSRLILKLVLKVNPCFTVWFSLGDVRNRQLYEVGVLVGETP